MSWLARAKQGADLITVGIAAIETISAVVKAVRNKTKSPEDALNLVEDIVGNVQAGWQGQKTAAEIRAEIEKTRDTLLDNAASADAAADVKFGKKPQ